MPRTCTRLAALLKSSGHAGCQCLPIIGSRCVGIFSNSALFSEARVERHIFWASPSEVLADWASVPMLIVPADTELRSLCSGSHRNIDLA